MKTRIRTGTVLLIFCTFLGLFEMCRSIKVHNQTNTIKNIKDSSTKVVADDKKKQIINKDTTYQSSINLDTDLSKNKIKYVKGKKSDILYFKDSSINISKNDIIAVSPTGNRVAIMHYTGNDSTSIKVLNSINDELIYFNIQFLDKLAINDNGQFAVFGFHVNEDEWFENKPHLYCYNNKGELVFYADSINKPTGKGYFFKNSKNFYFLVDYMGPLMILNEDFQVIGEFNDITLRPYTFIYPKEANDIENNLRIIRSVKVGNKRIKEYLDLNIDGTYKKEKKWKAIN